MSGLRTVAHAPRWPAEHAPLACSARFRGLPPPAASRSLRSLLPAATPRLSFERINGRSPGADSARSPKAVVWRGPGRVALGSKPAGLRLPKKTRVRFERKPALIPLKDYPGPRRTFPWVMLTLVAVNIVVFIFELSLPSDNALNNLFYADGVVP